jgi:hypothetical protein
VAEENELLPAEDPADPLDVGELRPDPEGPLQLLHVGEVVPRLEPVERPGRATAAALVVIVEGAGLC